MSEGHSKALRYIPTPRREGVLRRRCRRGTIIRACVARIVDLEQDLRMRYVLIIKNHGQEAGAHITPSRSGASIAMCWCPTKGYWETIEADFHWHLELLPQVSRITGFHNPVPPEIVARCLTPHSEG